MVKTSTIPKTKRKTKAKTPPQKYNTLFNYVLLFLVCAFIGWIWEVVLTFIKTGSFINRGVLHGPWLPIYGFGGVIMALFLHRFDKHPFLVFLSSAITCGILEYFTGWFLETFMHLKWWDYSDLPLNLHGRVCLLSVISFGFCGLFVIYLLKPTLFQAFSRIPYHAKILFCCVFLAIFLTDVTYATHHPNTGEGITNAIDHISTK